MHIQRVASRLAAPFPRLLLGLLVVAAGLFAAPAARGQAPDSTQVARFQLADAYLRAGQYDRAIGLLEDLYHASPDAYAFYDKLKTAYESIKRYDDAIALVDERMAADPNPMLMAEKARLLYHSGQEEAAYEAWDAAVALAPADPNAYRVVYQSLLDVRLFERAIDVLVRAREAGGAPDAFQADLAYLYNLTGQHNLAMQEYLKVLAANDRQAGFVRSRLSRFTEQEEALRASIAATANAVREAPLNRAYREILGWLYIEAGRYDQAFDAYRAIDRLEQEEGQTLYGFAQTASDAAAYDVALRAYEEILQRHPDAPIAPQARFGVAEMHERWGRHSGERAFDEYGKPQKAPHFEQALATYRAFLERHPAHPLYADALRRIGNLQQDVFFDLPAAEATLQQVVTRYPDTPAADQAAFDLGRLAVLRGSLEEGRLRLTRLVDRLRTGELAEQTRYELALLHFYKGEFDAAQTLAEVMDVNTSTDVANDAIELKVLLMENRGPDSLDTPLRAYASAELLLRQRQPLAALDTLDALLARAGDHRIADETRFLRADALRAAGRYDAAYQAFAELPLLHPKSFLADRSLFTAAEIQERHLLDAEGALATYTRLLDTYPGSLLATEARQRIRRLRGDGV